MRPNIKALDDLANLTGGAVGIAASLKVQIQNELKSRMDERIANMDMVPREDFEALQSQVKTLQNRIEKMENKA